MEKKVYKVYVPGIYNLNRDSYFETTGTKLYTTEKGMHQIYFGSELVAVYPKNSVILIVSENPKQTK